MRCLVLASTQPPKPFVGAASPSIHGERRGHWLKFLLHPSSILPSAQPAFPSWHSACSVKSPMGWFRAAQPSLGTKRMLLPPGFLFPPIKKIKRDFSGGPVAKTPAPNTGARV